MGKFWDGNFMQPGGTTRFVILALSGVGFIGGIALHSVQLKGSDSAGIKPLNEMTLPEARVNSVGMKFVRIPAGSFMMGSNDGDNDEKPVHLVTISKRFWMGQTEVTQGQYEAVMGSNPSKYKYGANYPVETVSWNNAMAFCRKLGEMEGRRYTLPTEAQWEYCSRGGQSDASLDQCGWYNTNSGNATHAVAQKQPNAFGLYDMQGNVWEWCLDWYGAGYYSNSQSVDPQGPSSGTNRVLRGGGWFSKPAYCRSALRYTSPTIMRYYFNRSGFRVVQVD